ncbi:autotransporter outer membrane beta-barrel domain-containing protein [Devosia sp.]|uniref:autotransporter outer membrane beta-barrel domain-containing protein n=1 Tax=Devosia sp. TaxID=1871048 RepID=UPI0027355BD6|nr:autotransporter outer membrane beta-barrel domain-containing protein [Devosia sp.]MDP2781442.1 autotransporter outer membrane beta-barrel domain-containing protein [Devosia sp.]
MIESMGSNLQLGSAGFNVNLTDSATLGLSYNGQLGSGLAEHSAKAGFNIRF